MLILSRTSSYPFSGAVFEALDYKLLRLPGRGIPADHVFQFVEKEYVAAEEFYDAFMDDPADFMLRTYLPRVCGALEPLKMLPSFNSWFAYYLGIIGNVSFFGMPEIAGVLEALQKAGAEALKWRAHLAEEGQEMASMMKTLQQRCLGKLRAGNCCLVMHACRGLTISNRSCLDVYL